MDPLVSVNIIVYNREKYVYQAIQSILKQDYKNLEIIIIDDGSTDNTISILKSLKDERIKLAFNDGNQGIAYSRNHAIKYSNGVFILIFDSDDVAHPDLVREKVNYLTQHSDYIAVSSLMNYIDHEGNILSKNNGVKLKDKELPFYLFFSNCLVQSSILIKANILKSNFYNSGFCSEDYNLWIRLSPLGKIHLMDKVFIDVRLHSENTTVSEKYDPIKAVKEIVTINLAKLNLCVSQKTMELHIAFLSNNYLFSVNEMAALVGHLNNIIVANNYLKIYDREQFKYFIFKNLEMQLKQSIKFVELPSISVVIFSRNISKELRIKIAKVFLKILSEKLQRFFKYA